MGVPTALMLLFSCVHAPLAAMPPAGAPSAYDVAVAVASADRVVTATYTLELVPEGEGVFTVRTVRTRGTWEEGGRSWTFDSEAPTSADPWPLALQHAVASVPAALRFSEDGSPMGLVSENGWRMAGMDAVQSLDLPSEAWSAGEQLLDPAGLVRDLQRTFPGTPPDGLWVREESIAGLSAHRVEQCDRRRAGGEVTWRCVGDVEAETPRARLHDTSSESVVVTDARGLVSVEGTYSGTLLVADASGQDVTDRPVAGRRMVVRR